jgi:hypothetical protein
MDIDFIIWLAVLAFVLTGWAYLLASVAHIETVTESSIVLRTIFGKHYRIESSIVRGVERWVGFMPRLIIRITPPRFFYLGISSFWVPLSESRPVELQAAEELMNRYSGKLRVS